MTIGNVSVSWVALGGELALTAVAPSDVAIVPATARLELTPSGDPSDGGSVLIGRHVKCTGAHSCRVVGRGVRVVHASRQRRPATEWAVQDLLQAYQARRKRSNHAGRHCVPSATKEVSLGY